MGDPVLHIQLAERNTCLVIAPADANTLAKLAHGAADNLLTCVARAWPWAMDDAFTREASQVGATLSTE